MKKLKCLCTCLIFVLTACNCNNSINANSLFANDEEIHMCTFDLMNSQNNFASKAGAAIIDWPRWNTGQTIKIKFLDGDLASQEKVKKIAGEWTKYANLIFEYVPINEDADIRIGFDVGRAGAWSDLGMKSTYGTGDYQNEPSMRLGSLAADEKSIRRTVLHEFGHALGLIHETTNPDANINWDLPKVYEYYSELMGWSKEDVDTWVINKASTTNYSKYDPLSIMHYSIDPKLTTDGIGTNEMDELSMTDMASINKWYPFPVKSTIEPGERIDKVSWSQAKSPNGRYSLDFTSGYLFLFDTTNNQIIWSVGNPFYRNASCYLESNGNIIIKGMGPGFSLIRRTVWTSNTSEFPGAKLELRDDGDLQLIYNGAVKWSSKTGKI